MTALAPICPACWIMSSKASWRVRSHRLLKSEMLPPTMVCRLAPKVPTMERERTTMPRTTPRLRFTRKPYSSNAVVTFSWGTTSASRAPVDFDHGRILHDNAFLQPVTGAPQGHAIDRGLHRVAALHHGPFLP